MTEFSEQDYRNWWAEPVGREVRKLLEARIVQIDGVGLTEAVIRDQVKAAVYLGQKIELEGLLEMNYNELKDFQESRELEKSNEILAGEE